MVHVVKNLVKIFVNLYFSDFEPSCLLFGGLCSKCPFYRNELFLREEFLKPILTWTNTPQQFFWIYFSLFKSLFSIFIFIWVIGKLSELACKILELYDQNSWRNILSKLATFDPILQRPHSALVHLADSALPSSLSLISKNLQNQEMKGNHF